MNEQASEARQRIIRTCNRVIAESEQIIRDIEWWNANRLDAQPFDCGSDRCRIVYAKEILRLATEWERIPDSLMERLHATC